MIISELIEELKRYPAGMRVSVFVDWPEDLEEQSGLYDIDRVRPGSGEIEIRLCE